MSPCRRRSSYVFLLYTFPSASSHSSSVSRFHCPTLRASSAFCSASASAIVVTCVSNGNGKWKFSFHSRGSGVSRRAFACVRRSRAGQVTGFLGPNACASRESVPSAVCPSTPSDIAKTRGKPKEKAKRKIAKRNKRTSAKAFVLGTFRHRIPC